MTAGASQNPGQTRLELLERNVEIFEGIVPRITERIDDETIVLVVTNPVDVLSYVTRTVSDLPHERVIGSGTVLDTARFKQALGEYCDVATPNVHAYVVGEHGDSEVPVWSAAHLAGLPFEDYCEAVLDESAPEARERISGTVAGAAYEIIEAVVRDEDAILTVSMLREGQYGLEDIYLSLPCVVNRGGVRRILEYDLTDDERDAPVDSADVLAL